MTIVEITNKFRIAKVGGCVRDSFLGLDPKDVDFVVEAAEAEFEFAFPEFVKVGNSFPVYLVEGNEVALTRTEKSTGSAYTEFEYVAGVSIEADLARRDFTFNSIAIEVGTGLVIDPFNGLGDLKNGLIKTINKEAFIEDPLRILRAARFAARFGFVIEEETKELIKASSHLLETVTPERIEQELRKTYEQSETPSIFFRVLDEVGGLIPHFQELFESKFVVAGPIEFHPEGSTFEHLLISFDKAKAKGFDFAVGIAALLHDLGKIESPEPPKHLGHDLRVDILDRFFARHRFTADVQELSKVTFRRHMEVHTVEKIKKPVKLIRFVRRIRSHLFDRFLQAASCDAELTVAQEEIIAKTRKAIAETKIEIPKEVLKKGKEVVVNFVEQKYVETFKEITK